MFLYNKKQIYIPTQFIPPPFRPSSRKPLRRGPRPHGGSDSLGLAAGPGCVIFLWNEDAEVRLSRKLNFRKCVSTYAFIGIVCT